ncbi:hypothetical protein CERSUDRAFT_61806 [Gelatoporia subvermispora B]|uniref:Uncharacterized protein n=1 Tax=Ceriporiopsis subvermispora (strain B) TaxID=914234 RepID=M2PY64_CERS8|nr:hypothetical protein CERSUDRAFT_61806 [Gelatoporia subvermispora B]
MLTDSPPSGDSGSTTPFLSSSLPGSSMQNESDSSMKSSRPRSPSTPPPRTQPFSAIDIPAEATGRGHSRRLSHAVKAPRILTLISEARPEENEVKSEAQFQRLVASCSESPAQSRIPRAASDRGRYPEEADHEDPLREDTPSDDGEFDEPALFAYTEPAISTKPVTPAQSVNGDDNGMLDSPGGVAMDVDLPPSVSASPSISSWRYTPPPTSSAVRSNKRKMEDRYDPYPTSAKRRAVSPSISHLRDLNSRSGNGTPRLTMPIPIPIPPPGSGASSPIVSASSYFGSGRASFGSTSALSSPTMRAQIGLASPVLRPMVRARRDEERELREIDGAGLAVNGLSLT